MKQSSLQSWFMTLWLYDYISSEKQNVKYSPDGADILLKSRRAKEIKARAGIGIVENAQAFCFWILLKKVPSNSESNYEISIRRIWGCIEIVACHCRIEMLSFKKDSCLADASIDEEIY